MSNVSRSRPNTLEDTRRAFLGRIDHGENAPKRTDPDTLDRLTRGAASHRKEVLLGKLRDLGVSLTPEL